MDVIVSNNAKDYVGFIKVSKLSDVVNITGKIDNLVLHKFNESDEVIVRILTKLKDEVGKLIYIREEESCNKTIQMIVLGSDGKYFNDEFFLDSGEELRSLLNNINEVYTITELSGANIVNEFFNKYLKEGKTNFTTGYLSSVKMAVSSMLESYKAKDLELLQLSETATEIFMNNSISLSKSEEEMETLKNVVMSLQEVKDSIVSKSTIPKGSNILFFPQISYIKERNIIRVKELGNFHYLSSFMLGLRIYLESVKYVKPKLIFVLPVGEQYEDTYKDFKWVTQQNATTMSVYYDSIVFTNFPTTEVLSKLLDDKEYDTFIVVDRLKSSQKHILNCKGSSVKYAISSTRFLDYFNLKSIDCFFNKDIKGSLGNIKHDTEYPDEVEQRERYYLREYKDSYEMLYNIKRG